MNLDIIYIVAIVVYATRVIFFVRGSRNERSKKYAKGYQPSVSIIIPARNEESTVQMCIESIAQSTYPENLLEVIVVNDRSSDKTQDVINALASAYSFVVPAHIVDDSEKEALGKAGALHCGIQRASGDICLLTDADCTVSPEWIETMVLPFAKENVGMVCSYTLISSDSFFHSMQAVEWHTTHTMASAGVNSKHNLGCFGNNMAIRKQHYQSLGGYPSIPFSVTEDLALMQAMASNQFDICYLCTSSTAVKTQACNSVVEYFSQHKRWAKGGLQLGWMAFLFSLTSFALWFGLAASIIQQEWLWFAAIFLTRLLGDFFINIPSLRIYNQQRLIPYIFPTVLFFSLVEVVLPILLIDPRIKWKGQTFR